MKSIYPISSLLNLRKMRSLLSFGIKGYLAEIGWFVAQKHNSSVNGLNQPIPWFTYSFIDFMEDRLMENQRVFEYGSGNSTRYFATKCASITSVEHDEQWYKTGQKDIPNNATIKLIPLDSNGNYCRAASNETEKFDIIIIDGRDRVNCCKNSVTALSEKGVLILDDSEREKYNDARIFLESKGYKELSFSGISPGFFYRKATSIFYRTENCFRI